MSTLFRVSTVPGNERPEIRRIRWDGGKFKITEISLKSRDDHFVQPSDNAITQFFVKDICSRTLISSFFIFRFVNLQIRTVRRNTVGGFGSCFLVRNEISIAVRLVMPRANQVPWERLTNFVSCKNSLLHVRQCMLIATRNTRRLSSLSICYFNPGSNYVR